MSSPPEHAGDLRLRADLELTVLCDTYSDGPDVVITDPMRGSYFQLRWPESALLLAWHAMGRAGGIADASRRLYALEPSPEDTETIIAFARTNQLIDAHGATDWRQLATQAIGKRRNLATRLLHSYLFFRIPLVRPARHLARWAPRLSWLYAAWFWRGIAATAALALYLASRQWADVVGAVEASFSVQALAVFAIAALGLKAVHEYGHALTAAHLGCRVPSMGVAVMLGTPVFYTDVSDTWRLARRADRLKVVFAGVAAEAIVATVCLLSWALMANGVLRALTFSVATSAILMSLVVNLNPLMRFDGYFALSDWWRLPNLQARAFDLAAWDLRERLFDIGAPAPEAFGPTQQRKVLAYAWATAIYRLFLFLGIALVLLYAFGKAIGLVLAAIEIGIFIALPIWREIKEWWIMRANILARPRARVTLALTAAVMVVLLVPWIGTATAPAVLVAGREEPLHLIHPAVLTEVSVRDQQLVRAGAILFRAKSPELERDLAKARQELALSEQLAGRWHASGKERDARLVIERRLAAAVEKVAGIERRIASLQVRAPFDGRVVDLDPVAMPGRWFATGTALARVIDDRGLRARAVLSDQALLRVKPGAAAVFIEDDAARPSLRLVLASVQPASDGRLTEPILAERHGGTLATGGQHGDRLVRQGGFEATLTAAAMAPQRLVRGMVHIDAERVSPAGLLWSSVARVVVREQGF